MCLSILGLTNSNDAEIAKTLAAFKRGAAGTGFIHESYSVNDVAKYNRLWFGRGDSLFGELVGKVAEQRSQLLRHTLVG